MENSSFFKVVQKFITRLLKQPLLKLIGKDYGIWLEEFKKFFRKKVDWVKAGELVSEPTSSWRVENGVIYFSVTSNGMTGAEHITLSENKGCRIKNYAKSVLYSYDYKPTAGVMTMVAVLKGTLFEADYLTTQKILDEAEKRQLSKPNAEIACLIRDKFSCRDIRAMGLCGIVVMHDPIRDSDKDLSLLCLNGDEDDFWLDAYCSDPVRGWGYNLGFAFVVSEFNSSLYDEPLVALCATKSR